MKIEEVTEKTKIYFINRTKGKVGSFFPVFVNKKDIPNNHIRLQITFEVNKKDARDKFDYYFSEQEWLNDIKEL